MTGLAATPVVAEEALSTLPAVTVSSFYKEYNDLTETTSLGFEADPMTVPVSSFVLNQDVLEDQQVNNVDDALRNVAGVTKFKTGNGGEEIFAIHGFRADLYTDGQRRIYGNNRTFVATTETSNIERIEVLKGPSAILYGFGEPGGVINYVTKKPEFKRYTSAEVIGGSYDYGRVEVDTTGAFQKGSNFAYRLVASHQDANSFRDELFRERTLLAPSLTFDNGKTNVTLQYEWIKDHYTQTRGQALLPDLSNDPYVDETTFFGIPGFNDRTESEYQKWNLRALHEFSPIYSVGLTLSRADIDKDYFDAHPRQVELNHTIRFTSGEKAVSDASVMTAQLDQNFRFSALGAEHKAQLSLDRERQKAELNSQTFTGLVVYDLITRTYSGLDAFLATVASTNPPVTQSITSAGQQGVNLQDLMSFGERWHLLVGVRQDDYEDRANDLEDDATTYRTGLVYQPAEWLSVYGGFATGFKPVDSAYQSANRTNGRAFVDPETSEQAELGAKFSLLDGKASLLFSVYEARKQDMVALDPAAVSLPSAQQYYTNIGEVRARGFDAQFTGRIGEQWRLITAYAYTDATMEDDGDASARFEGNTMAGIPLHNGSVWAVYEFAGALKGLSLGTGVFAQTKSPKSYESFASNDGHAQMDLMAAYKTRRVKYQLNVKNVADETHHLTQEAANYSLARSRADTSSPRTIFGSVAVEF
jgi:TonB-dependent siderophore receptor